MVTISVLTFSDDRAEISVISSLILLISSFNASAENTGNEHSFSVHKKAPGLFSTG